MPKFVETTYECDRCQKTGSGAEAFDDFYEVNIKSARSNTLVTFVEGNLHMWLCRDCCDEIFAFRVKEKEPSHAS